MKTYKQRAYKPFWRDDLMVTMPWSGCWIWLGTTIGAGYGEMSYHGHKEYTHRAAWIEHYGPIPLGQSVLHRCDVMTCINPAHLFLGTQADNLADMRAKGRDAYRPTRGANHPKAVLDKESSANMLKDAAAGMTKSALMAKYGVRHSTVEAVKNGTHWTVRSRQ